MVAFEFAKYRRPQFEGPNHKRASAADSHDDQCLPKVSATCWVEYQKIRRAKLIVSLVSLRLREKLQIYGKRIQREIEEYRILSELN
jgi:hypothetical protein